MILNDRDVMVTGKGILFPYGDSFDGYRPMSECDYRARILREPRFIDESQLDRDDKHVFSYVAFLNATNGEVFTFSRRDGKKSLYIEGPIYYEDASKGSISLWGNTLTAGVMRLINKQINFPYKVKLDTPGFINFERADKKDRFGILYVGITESDKAKTHSRKTKVVPVTFGGNFSLPALEKLCEEDVLDDCSKVILTALKEYGNFL